MMLHQEFSQARTAVLAALMAASAASVGLAPSALAQETIGGGTGKAQERKPPVVPGGRDGDLYEPLGLRRGAFLINPYIVFEYGNDDNVFADDTNKQSDGYFEIRPGFTAYSLWSRHELKLFGDIAKLSYGDLDSEDTDAWNLGATGRIDMDRRRFIDLGIQFGETDIGRDNLQDPNLPEPSKVDYTQFSAGWYHEFNRLYYRVGASYSDDDYKPVSVGGISFNNDDRDFDRTILSAEVGYEFAPEYLGFVRLEQEDTDYAINPDDLGINRDSDGTSLLLGFIVDREDILTGRVYTGYRSRDFDDPGEDKISGGVLGAGLTWELSRLTTLDLDLDRTIEDASGTDAAGLMRTTIDLRAEHELYRNVWLDASLGWYDDDFRGIDRSDDGFLWSIGGKYLANRWLRVGASYEHDDRDSSGADADETSSYGRDVFRVYVELIR